MVLIPLPLQVKELGSGSYGTCMLAEDADGEMVAVKFIQRGSKVYSLLTLVVCHRSVTAAPARSILCTAVSHELRGLFPASNILVAAISLFACRWTRT